MRSNLPPEGFGHVQIIRELESLRHREHAATVDLIAALCVCHRTRAYADAGYGSVWQLLVRRLEYSPAAASRRNAAMRCALRHPVVLEMLRAHRTTLSALHKIEKTLLEARDPSSILRRLDGATQDDVERIVAAARPVAKPVERVRRVVVKRRAGGVRTANPANPANPTNSTETTSSRRSSAAELPFVRPGADHSSAPAPNEPEERVQLTFSLSRADFAKLERLKSKLSNRLPAGMTLEQIFVLLMDDHLKPPRQRSAAEPTKRSDANSRSRHVPAATRRAVFDRDRHRCVFVAPDGTQCGSDHDLEIDHCVPFALGGSHDASNLRVLCRTHNQRRAELTFGVP